MRVSLCSDLHQEFCDLCSLPGGDLLLLAGDCFGAHILPSRKNDADSRSSRKRQTKFAEQELSKYQRGLYVMGNHDHWGGLFEDSAAILRDFFAEHCPNVQLLDNEAVEIEGVAILGTTLWARCGYGTPEEWRIRNAMRDFERIRTCQVSKDNWAIPRGSRRAFAPSDAHAEMEKARQFLQASCPTDKPVIVLTHHAPSFASGHGIEYGSPYLDDAYCTNLVDFFLDRPNIKLAVHGHTHHHERYRIGETGPLVLSNPRGYYPYERRAHNFDPTAEDFDLRELFDE